MTGILPIKKYGEHSALNMFDEYSMTNQRELAEFTGFTGEEVQKLCVQYDMSFDSMPVLPFDFTWDVENYMNFMDENIAESLYPAYPELKVLLESINEKAVKCYNRAIEVNRLTERIKAIGIDKESLSGVYDQAWELYLKNSEEVKISPSTMLLLTTGIIYAPRIILAMNERKEQRMKQQQAAQEQQQ